MLKISCCGMELSWLFALAAFLVSATAESLDFPFLLSGILFIMAMSLAEFLSRMVSKRIWKVAAWGLLLALMIGAGLSSSGQTLLSGSIYDKYQAGLVILLMMGFGYKGFSLSSRKLSYASVCNHFDLGVGIISGLMLLKMLIAIKGGQKITGDAVMFFAIVFFMFSMTAVFIARNSGAGIIKYRYGFEIFGILITSGIILLLFAVGAVLFFLPGLTGITRDGYGLFLHAMAPLKPYIIRFLKVVLIGSGHSPGTTNAPLAGSMKWNGHSMADLPSQWIDTVVGIGFAGLALLVLVLTGVIFLYLLFKWLFSGEIQKKDREQKRPFFQRMIQWFLKIRGLVAGGMIRNNDWIVQSYFNLVRWGKRSGMPIRKNETPLEYAHRLSERFVPLGREIKMVIHFFCLEIYGQQKSSHDAVTVVRAAVKSMRHPRFWLVRIKSVFRGPGI